MLNDVVLLEAAQGIANRVISHAGQTEDRVTYLFELCLVRPPTASEIAAVAKYHKNQQARFATDAKRAEAVACGEGERGRARAWTATARAILNLDEFITKE